MRDSIEVSEHGKFFFYYPSFLPELTHNESLFVSWLLHRIRASHEKRLVEIAKEVSRQYGSKPVYDAKPIDEWWVSCTDKRVSDTFPFMSKRNIRRVIQSLSNKQILQTKVIQ